MVSRAALQAMHSSSSLVTNASILGKHTLSKKINGFVYSLVTFMG